MKKQLSKKYKAGIDYEIVSNPEFLREGRAVFDFYNPDRIVIGGETKKSVEILKDFLSLLYSTSIPYLLSLS